MIWDNVEKTYNVAGECVAQASGLNLGFEGLCWTTVKVAKMTGRLSFFKSPCACYGLLQ